jgi:hypothetical protein
VRPPQPVETLHLTSQQEPPPNPPEPQQAEKARRAHLQYLGLVRRLAVVRFCIRSEKGLSIGLTLLQKELT